MRAGPVHNQYARLPWLIAAMTAAALAIGIIAALYVEGRLVASKGETLALAASEVAHKLDLVLAEQYDDTLELSRASVFHKRDASEQSAYLSAVKRLHSNFLWLGVADARGRIVASTDPAAIGKALSERALFQAARDTGRVQVGDVQPFVEAGGGIDAVSFAAPITSPRGSFHGVVATHVGLPHLEQVIARTIEAIQARQELKEVIEYRFATARGDVFVESEPLHENHANLEQLGLLSARQSKSGQPGYIEEEHPHRQDRIITGYALTRGAGKFPGLKWTVLLHADRDAMVAPIWNMLRKLAAAWALVWLPMLGFSLWSARRLKQAWAQVQEERAHAETAESKYRDLVEQAEDIIYQVDLHGYFTYINPAVTRYKGYTQYELIGRHFTEHIRPDAREAARRYYLRQFARKTPSTYYEFPVIKKDGGEIWFGQNVRLLIENDRPVGFLAVARDITERKRAEEQLRKNEERLQIVIRATNDVIWDWDLNTDAVQWSQGIHTLFGYKAEDIEPGAQSWYSRLHTDDRERVMTDLHAAIDRGEQYWSDEYRFRRADGSDAYVFDRGYVLRDNAGKAVRMIGAMQDVTERKQAEERFAKINECFLNFGVNSEININNLTALCGELLGAACALYNYLDGPLLRSIGKWNAPPGFNPVDPAVGHICHDVIQEGADHPVTVHDLPETRYAQTDPNVLPYKLKTYFGMAVKCRDTAVGSLCAVFQQDYVPSEADAKLLGIIAVAIGVEEERRRGEEALRESEKRFRTIFDQAPLGIAVIESTSGRFRRINKTYCDIVAYSSEELLARTFMDITHPDDLQADLDNMTHLMEGQTNGFKMEKRYIRKDNSIVWVNLTCVPLWLEEKKECRFHIAMVEDITERKHAEQRLHERSRQQAIEAELGVLAVTIQDLPHLLSTAAGLVSNALEVNYCEVLELVPNGTDLRLCASAGWRGDDIGQVRALETGSPAHAALNSNKPVIRTLPTESRFGGPKWLHEHGTVTAMSVSIPGKDGPWGVLGVYTTLTRAFSRDDVNFLQTVSSILATAIERMQAESVLRSANQALRLLSRQLLQVQEDDRRAIARDLHDEIGQSLTAIKLNVERAQRTADRDLRTHIMRDCAQITEQVLGQVRNLSLDLHPSILDDLGLAYALKWYADRQAERAGLKVELTADPSLPRLPQDIEISCFRIAQEALTNVVRHARADLASITLKRGGSSVELCIQDDGVGFVVDQASAQTNGRSSVGLASMQERAKLLGGTVKIMSAPQCGTTVVATLPLPVASPAGMTTEQAGRS